MAPSVFTRNIMRKPKPRLTRAERVLLAKNFKRRRLARLAKAGA
jgi:hypothetical protein